MVGEGKPSVGVSSDLRSIPVQADVPFIERKYKLFKLA